MDVWIQLLTDVGFPIFVTFYLLHRIENQLARLIQAIYDLPEQLRIP
ncbi:MAG TPA: YvrJ family protein [Bacillota bacterium]|nr:YvrJ family protein [Bacillota bacterium]